MLTDRTRHGGYILRGHAGLSQHRFGHGRGVHLHRGRFSFTHCRRGTIEP